MSRNRRCVRLVGARQRPQVRSARRLPFSAPGNCVVVVVDGWGSVVERHSAVQVLCCRQLSIGERVHHGTAQQAAASESESRVGSGGLSFAALRVQFPFAAAVPPGHVPLLRKKKMCATQAEQADVLLMASRAMVSGQIISHFRDEADEFVESGDRDFDECRFRIMHKFSAEGYYSPEHMLEDESNSYVEYYLANKDRCLPRVERRQGRRMGRLTQAQTVLLRSLSCTLVDLRLELKYNELACRRIGRLPVRDDGDRDGGELARWALDVCSSFIGVQRWGPRLDTLLGPGGVVFVSSRARCDAIAALTVVAQVCRGLHGRRLPSLVIDHICAEIVGAQCPPQERFRMIQRINEFYRH